MTSTGSFPKRIARAFSDDSTIAFDLVSHLTYMSVLATARASRERLLELSVNMPYRTREAFQRVLNMVRRLGFEHVRAFQLVAAATQIEALKGILSRFAGSIVSGGNEAVFLQQETVVAMERYMAQYERAVEALKKWTDGYAALLVSAALVVVVGIISTLMYAISPLFIAGMGAGMIGFVLVGVYVIWRSAPVEVKTYDANGGPFIRRLSRRLLILGLPLGAAGAYILSRRYGLGGALLSLGVALLPSGLCAFLDDSRVDRIDRDLPNLLRSLGALTTSLGSTLAAALEKIDRKAMGSLEKPIRRLHGRLIFRLDPAACWDRFFQETGSQLAFRTGRPLVDGIRMGGLAEKVGETCSTFALQNVLLRSKRQMVADTFMYLTIPLHASMVGLLLFVLQIVVNFNTKINELMKGLSGQMSQSGSGFSAASLPMFQVQDVGPSVILTYSLILTLTVANALAPKAAAGGHWLKTGFFLSLTLIISGLCMVVIPPAAAALFKM